MPFKWYAFEADDIDFLSQDKVGEGYSVQQKQNMLFRDLVYLDCLMYMYEHPHQFNQQDLKEFSAHSIKITITRPMSVHDCIYTHIQHYAHKYSLKTLHETLLDDAVLPALLKHTMGLLKERIQKAYVTLCLFDHAQYTFAPHNKRPQHVWRLGLALLVAGVACLALHAMGILPPGSNEWVVGLVRMATIVMLTLGLGVVAASFVMCEQQQEWRHSFQGEHQRFKHQWETYAEKCDVFLNLKRNMPSLNQVYEDEFHSCKSNESPTASLETERKSPAPA